MAMPQTIETYRHPFADGGFKRMLIDGEWVRAASEKRSRRSTRPPAKCSPPSPIGCHTFRATGITAYLANGGALEHAQEMAAHESPRTTKLYDRTKERLTQDEVERIRL